MDQTKVISPSAHYYEVTPRLIPADTDAEIAIRPLYGHVQFLPDTEYEIRHLAMDDSLPRPGGQDEPVSTTICRPVNGVLRFRSRFAGEGEHRIFLKPVGAEERTPAAMREIRLYSLAPDLLARRPYKGDFHVHSCRSDGQESPDYVAAAGRRIGLDFMALTDHGQYAPSQEAIAAFAELPHDLRLFPGEEVHPPHNPVHMVHFGGSFSVNALFSQPEYAREVEERQRELQDTLPAGVDPALVASCLWCFDKMRAAGGLAIFCHPYWIYPQKYHIPPALTAWMLENRPFDAFELMGGFYQYQAESNWLQAAHYHEARGQYGEIPIVGASDAHGCDRNALFGWYYTIVFSPSLELADLIRSIKSGYSVAIEALPGEFARAHGPFRLVKYASYLLREILPLHDELCVEEGRLMRAHLAGEEGVAAALQRLNGRCDRLYERIFSAGA